ncbi:hypothetical protein KHV-MN_00089 [Cyprinid herpesvirus 3]|nr:hypothetical protein KHV-MN_00089 [Cyprinid herpesvirus 3]
MRHTGFKLLYNFVLFVLHIVAVMLAFTSTYNAVVYYF